MLELGFFFFCTEIPSIIMRFSTWLFGYYKMRVFIYDILGNCRELPSTAEIENIGGSVTYFVIILTIMILIYMIDKWYR